MVTASVKRRFWVVSWLRARITCGLNIRNSSQHESMPWVLVYTAESDREGTRCAVKWSRGEADVWNSQFTFFSFFSVLWQQRKSNTSHNIKPTYEEQLSAQANPPPQRKFMKQIRGSVMSADFQGEMCGRVTLWIAIPLQFLCKS